MREWERIPLWMRNSEVQYYYNILRKKKCQILLKRIFDLYISALLIVILFPVLVIISMMIRGDSKGSIFYRQVRVTAYGRKFRIFKFRTMVENADEAGSQVTVRGDTRITNVGKLLRKYRLDELPQLFNVFLGDMTFVGTRPEVPGYVEAYDDRMKATLLLPAGITSRTSIIYKDEDALLESAADVDCVYIEEVLPKKMKYNLEEIEKFNIFRDLKTMMLTIMAVLK